MASLAHTRTASALQRHVCTVGHAGLAVVVAAAVVESARVEAARVEEETGAGVVRVAASVVVAASVPGAPAVVGLASQKQKRQPLASLS